MNKHPNIFLTKGEKRNACRILVGRPRRRCVDNTKIDLIEIGWDGVDWIDVAQNRDQSRALVKTLLNLRVP
jgi:DeoR/GlpR family transcriptional regulator of sugar metabolism